MAKKKRKKHNITIPPKGPQSEQFLKKRKKRKLNMKFGLSRTALKDLGYKYQLGTFQKILFVASICLGMIPFWFVLEKKEYAQSRLRSFRVFFLNLCLWVLFVLLIVFWSDIMKRWSSL
jgi:hypothetical protein